MTTDRKAIDKLKFTLDTALDAANAIEAAGVALLAKVAPWAAPLPTAYLVWERTVARFGWPWQVGAATAAAVEALGLVTTLTALEAWSWNRTRTRQSDPRAPLALPLALVGGYFITAELLTIGLDVLPRWGSLAPVDFVPAIFPVLSLVGVGVIAVRVDQAQRAAEVEAAIDDRRRQRQERRQAAAQVEQVIDSPIDELTTSDKVLDIYRQDPGARVVDVAARLDVSRQTVYNHLSTMESAGKIRRNGHGVEVVEEAV
jgi:hypothetical protein